MRVISVADLHVGDHVELGPQGYEVSDVEQRPGQVEVVDTAGSVHIYSSGAVVSIRSPAPADPADLTGRAS